MKGKHFFVAEILHELIMFKVESTKLGISSAAPC